MESTPIGFKFMPTKQELLYYLKKKVMGEPLPWDGIQEKDLYSDNSPWELFNENYRWETLDDDDDDDGLSSRKIRKHIAYCFTRLKKLTPYCKRKYLRSCGCGFWHEISGEKRFSNNDGIMKFFKFKKRGGLLFDEDAAKDDWTMIQISLSMKFLEKRPPLYPDYVICRITRHVVKRVSRKQVICPTSWLNLLEDSRVYKEEVPDLNWHGEESRICDYIVQEGSRIHYYRLETAAVPDLDEESRIRIDGEETAAVPDLDEESRIRIDGEENVVVPDLNEVPRFGIDGEENVVVPDFNEVPRFGIDGEENVVVPDFNEVPRFGIDGEENEVVFDMDEESRTHIDGEETTVVPDLDEESRIRIVGGETAVVPDLDEESRTRIDGEETAVVPDLDEESRTRIDGEETAVVPDLDEESRIRIDGEEAAVVPDLDENQHMI